MSIRRNAFFHVDTDGLAAIYRGHGRVWEGRDPFFLSAVESSLRFFEEVDARATYFVIAEDLEDKEKLEALRGVAAAGHEIACHGFRHRYLNRVESELKREEIVDAKAAIEDGLGVAVRGFRAPGYSIDAESLELLAGAGYAYDSSVFPTFAFRERLGLQRLYPDPFEILPDAGLMEFPMPVAGAFLPPFHPAYAFYLRRAYFRSGLRRSARRADHLTLLFHFTDFAEPQEAVDSLRLRIFTNDFFAAETKRRFLAGLVADVRETWEVTTTERFLAEGRHEEPRLRPRTILGVSTTHETGAAVVRDGEILSAITEERLTRKKLDNRYPPEDSIREAIRVAGIEAHELDGVAIAGLDSIDLLPQSVRSLVDDLRDYHALNDYFPHFVRLLYRLFYFFRARSYRKVERFLEAEYGIRPKLWFVEHHSAHAASAFRTGEAQEALVVTADGVGDDVCMSFSRGRGRTLRTIARYYYPNSFGQFYTACTQILGFKAGRHEGKITGLAGYGTPNETLLREVERTFFDRDGFRLGKRYYAEGFPRPRKGMLAEIRAGKPVLYAIEYRNYKAPLKRLLQGYGREEVAWAFQHLLEREMVRLVGLHGGDAAGGPLCLAGGVFANVKLNMALSQELGSESIYVFPAMGDGGLCVGAALEVAATAPHPVPNVYLGTAFGEDDIDRALAGHPELHVERPAGPARLRRRRAGRRPHRRTHGRAHGVRAPRARQPLHPLPLRRPQRERLAEPPARPHRVHALRAHVPVRGRGGVLRAPPRREARLRVHDPGDRLHREDEARVPGRRPRGRHGPPPARAARPEPGHARHPHRVQGADGHLLHDQHQLQHARGADREDARTGHRRLPAQPHPLAPVGALHGAGGGGRRRGRSLPGGLAASTAPAGRPAASARRRVSRPPAGASSGIRHRRRHRRRGEAR